MDDQPVHFQFEDSFTTEDDDAYSHSNSNSQVSAPCFWQSPIFTNNNQFMLHPLHKSTTAYTIVSRSFINGMKNFENFVDVVAIHRKNYKFSAMDNAREEAFRVFASAIATKNGGDPNIKYGWYGGPREQIRDILCFGFRPFEDKTPSYGRGVYFSPANNSHASKKTLIADSNGLMHVLLCQLILGKQELIPFGSENEQPSSTEFDSGVDDISSPTKYIIWEPYINTHILPLFIVSYKANSLTGVRRDRLHAEIKIHMTHLPNYLTSLKMGLIRKLHDQFNQKKILEETFVRNFRIIAGADVLSKIIRLHNASKK